MSSSPPIRLSQIPQPQRTPLPRRSSMSSINSVHPFTSSGRRQSRVRFDDRDSPYIYAYPDEPSMPESSNAALSTQPDDSASPQWNIPVYDDRQTGDGINDGQSNQYDPVAPHDARRGSDDSQATLNNEEAGETDPYKKYSFSSYQHPYDIPAPPPAHGGSSAQPYSSEEQPPRPPRSALRRSVSFADSMQTFDDPEAQVGMQKVKGDSEDQIENSEGAGVVDNQDRDRDRDRDGRRRGVLSNLIELYGLNQSDDEPRSHRGSHVEDGMSRTNSERSIGHGFTSGIRLRRNNSNFSNDEEIIDADDPRITGITKDCLDDYDDERHNVLRQMDYRQRRKERQKTRIEFNVTSIINRHHFLLKLARALMTFGAPSHRIESQLVAAARILEVDAEFIHLPSVIICSFGDSDTMTSETHFIKCSGRLALGSLHKVHLIYRAVVHDEISAKKATQKLEELLTAEPLYGLWFRCSLAFFLSVLICPLSFGGSFLDMWIAGVGAFLLSFLQLTLAAKSAMYANVFEITTAILMSFTARGLSSIRSEIFCYTAISSSGIIGILPGYLILSSSLELASKNIVCGSVKMVYALIYTLFLGFGLQIGSDLYLLFDPGARHSLQTLSGAMSASITLLGTFRTDNATVFNTTAPLIEGTFTFTNATSVAEKYIINGCYRPPSFPWYLQPFPLWTQFVIVPIFSLLSSLANLQPWKSKQLPVMIVISCASYASNSIANHYIFNRSDIVSAIGAFTVGLLGNIYSRKMGGTAFTSMVTGVLFLVPSGLSQAGGITANDGNGVDIGGAMIAVTIGITVGLFMSQALVYMFGSRKNAAVFSF